MRGIKMIDNEKNFAEIISNHFRSYNTSRGLTFGIGFEAKEPIAIIKDFNSCHEHESILSKSDIENILAKMNAT